MTSWAEHYQIVNQAVYDALLASGKPDVCYRCGKAEHFKTDANGTLCERCADGRCNPIVNEKTRIGRNDPCPCGSGKKYKACCR